MKQYYIFLSITLILSCSNNKLKYEAIVGHWKLDTVIDSAGNQNDFFFITKPGIEFISTSQFRYLPGPVDLSREEQPILRELIDTVLFCHISENQISYNTLKNGKVTKEIVQLTLDSLYLLDSKKILYKYFRIYQDSTNNNSVNRIVLSSSGCYGVCPIIDIEVNKLYEASYYCAEYCGDNGFFKGMVQESIVERLFNFLDFIKIDTLKNFYFADHTDDETIIVSFYNDNNHVKTVSDYGRMAPTEFIWLYTYLRYMPGLRKLEANKVKNNSVYKSSYYVLSNGKKGYFFDRPESYGIYTKLLNAKVVSQDIVLPYEIYELSFPIQKLDEFFEYNGKPEVIGHSNGRYFRLKSMKNQIIDLGYNCLNMKESI